MASQRWRSAKSLLLVTLLFASFARSQTNGFNSFMVPGKNQKVNAGSTWTIVWEPAPKYGSKVSLSLLYGANEMDMEDGPVLATGLNVNDGKYAWTIPSSLPKAPCYGLRIYLDSKPSTFEYSYPFQISFAKAVVSSAVVAPVASTNAPPGTKEASPTSPSTQPIVQAGTTLQTVVKEVTKISISSSVVILVSSESGAQPVTVTESVTLSGDDGATVVNTIITGFTALAESLLSTTLLDVIPNAAAETHTVSVTAITTANPSNQSGTTINSTVSPNSLSKGAKAGISISAIIGVIIVAVVAWMLIATHYKRQQIAMRRGHSGYGAMKEETPSMDLGPVPAVVVRLSDEEKRELVNRRRAAELSGGDIVAVSEKEGSEKDELEARRREAQAVHEIG